MKEITVHNWFKTQAKKRYGDKFLYLKPPSGIYSSRRGISDFICCIYGVFFAVEVKVGKNKPTAIQQNFLCEVIEAGGMGLCLTDKDENIFNMIDLYVLTFKVRCE